MVSAPPARRKGSARPFRLPAAPLPPLVAGVSAKGGLPPPPVRQALPWQKQSGTLERILFQEPETAVPARKILEKQSLNDRKIPSLGRLLSAIAVTGKTTIPNPSYRKRITDALEPGNVAHRTSKYSFPNRQMIYNESIKDTNNRPCGGCVYARDPLRKNFF